jgi:chemotaxis protein methyltransferase CheR
MAWATRMRRERSPEARSDTDETGWLTFQDAVRRLAGVDLRAYKERQMRRRLGRLMRQLGVSTWWDFVRALRQDAATLRAFQDFFTINVSEFFRQPEQFDLLEREYLPRLLQHRPSLRVWSAGCANGAEPYSIAMILAARAPAVRHYVLATDVDARILDVARAADSYTEADVRNVPARLRSRYLERRNDRYRVGEPVRSMVDFRLHDLLRDPVEDDFDLVVCRNVVIYFTEDAKHRVYRTLQQALRPGGLLFVGATEVILKSSAYGLRPDAPPFYTRAA